MLGPIAITVVIAVPAVLPSDASLAGKVFDAEGGNAIEIYGHCFANSGKLTLYRNHSTADGTPTIEWYPVNNDKADAGALLVDTTLPAEAPGFFSKVYSTGDLLAGSCGASYVVLYSSAGGPADFDFLYAAGRRQAAP